jgi:hypothetical protein
MMKKLFFLVYTISILLGGCESPVGGSKKDEGSGLTVGLDYEGGFAVTRDDGTNALEGPNIIYRDEEPSSLTLRADGDWTEARWYVDGAGAPAVEGPEIRLEAASFRETAHTLSFTGLLDGKPYAALIPFVVSARRAADIVWTQTRNDTSQTAFDLAGWTGWGEGEETWRLGVIERPRVYFAVHKRSGQLIRPGGADGARVHKAAMDETVDGSTASETLDIFTVDTEDIFFDGGTRAFTLSVTEAGREEGKTVNVELAVDAWPTGIAIFTRDYGGDFIRITAGNAANHTNSYYPYHKKEGFPEWGLDFADVTNLATALKWLNLYAKHGIPASWTEYLIRVEQDEALYKSAVHCYGGDPLPILAADYVRIRLRGYREERILTHNIDNTGDFSYLKGKSLIEMTDGFLNVGLGKSNNAGLTHVALHLEKNITIDARNGEEDTNFPSGTNAPYIYSMVRVGKNCTFVLEEGARLINYKSESELLDFCAVVVDEGGIFEMNGGTLEHITITATNSIIYLHSSSGVKDGEFVYRRGEFIDTSNYFVIGRTTSRKRYDDPSFQPTE